MKTSELRLIDNALKGNEDFLKKMNCIWYLSVTSSVFPTVPCTLSNRWRVCLVQCWKSQVIKLSPWSLRKLDFLNVFITDRLFQMFCPYFLPLDFIFTSSLFSTCGLLTRWISCREFLICGALLASSLWQAVSLGHYLAALWRRKLVVRLQSRVFLNRKSEAKQRWYLDYHILLFVGWPRLPVSWGIVLNTSTFYYLPSWEFLPQTRACCSLEVLIEMIFSWLFSPFPFQSVFSWFHDFFPACQSVQIEGWSRCSYQLCYFSFEDVESVELMVGWEISRQVY